MSFSRAKAFPGWKFADPAFLTAAQMNAIDIDHENTLDKSVAGDTLSGTVALAAGGLIDGNTSGTKMRVSASGAKVAATASGASIEASVSGAMIQATTTGAKLRVTGGGVFETESDATGNINKAAQAYTFATPQSRTVRYLTGKVPVSGYPSGWSYDTVQLGAPQIKGAATTTPIYLPFTPHNGATIVSVTMAIQVKGPHLNLPSQLPYVSIVRVRQNPDPPQQGDLNWPVPWLLNYLLFELDDIGTPALALPNTPPSNFPRGPSMIPSQWDAGSVIQVWTNVLSSTPPLGTTGDPRIVDTSQYTYLVKLYDENGGPVVVGNTFPWFDITYSAISDLRFAT